MFRNTSTFKLVVANALNSKYSNNKKLSSSTTIASRQLVENIGIKGNIKKILKIKLPASSNIVCASTTPTSLSSPVAESPVSQQIFFYTQL